MALCKKFRFLPFLLPAVLFLACSVEEPTAPPGPGQAKPPEGKGPAEGVSKGGEGMTKGQPPQSPFPGEFKYTQEELKKGGKSIKVSGTISCKECEKYKDKDFFIHVVGGKPMLEPGKEPPKELEKRPPMEFIPLTQIKTSYSPTFEILAPKGAGEASVVAVLDIGGDGVGGRDLVDMKGIKVKDKDITGIALTLKEVGSPTDVPETSAPPEAALPDEKRPAPPSGWEPVKPPDKDMEKGEEVKGAPGPEKAPDHPAPAPSEKEAEKGAPEKTEKK